MATNPPTVEHLIQGGIAAARAGRYGEAQQMLRQAVRLAPNNEQAWLWLSGVEDGDQAKLTALHHVLRIDPTNVAARRGIEHLTQPKQVDVQQLVSPAATPPPPRAMPVPTPPPAPVATPTVIEPKSEPAQAVGADLLAELRPAIAKSRTKRPFWPRPSELVILLILIVMLFGGFIAIQNWLAGKRAELDPLGAATARPTSAAATAPSIVQPQPAVATQAPPPPSTGGYTSRAYNLAVGSTSVDASAQAVDINVTLTNTSAREVRFQASDFVVSNGRGQALRLNTSESSLLDGQGGIQSIPANGTLRGTLRFSGDITATPLTLTWRPFNGGTVQQIPLQ